MTPQAVNAETLYQDLLKGVKALSREGTRLVGIASGGLWLAQRLHSDLALVGSVGTISSTMHRDDFAKRGMTASGQTALDFDVNGADILLIDDVLFTGRTIRAVINELYDYGRPACVRLAVLVDRGGRELPVQPDFAAATMVLNADEALTLARDADGQFRFDVKES